MNRLDFTRLIGATQQESEYVPVACLLRSGYGVAGYFNGTLNEGMADVVVLINARLVDLRADGANSMKAQVRDFNEFLEDIVQAHYEGPEGAAIPESDAYGKSIPLAAIDLADIAVVYPVAHISKLMRSVRDQEKKVPSFLDFDNKSVILRLLRTKIW